MTVRSRQMYGALAILLVLTTGYLLKFGLYQRYFDISWDEEVQLHDGQVVLVHVTNTYERQGTRLKPYDESNIVFRGKTLTFETEPGRQYTFHTRLPVAYLGKFDKEWFVVISGQGPYGNHPDEMPTRWGDNFTTLKQRIAVLRNGSFMPIPWHMAPRQLVKMNLVESAFFTDFVAWNGIRLTLDKKEAFNAANTTPYRREISRPIGLQTLQGETK